MNEGTLSGYICKSSVLQIKIYALGRKGNFDLLVLLWTDGLVMAMDCTVSYVTKSL